MVDIQKVVVSVAVGFFIYYICIVVAAVLSLFSTGTQLTPEQYILSPFIVLLTGHPLIVLLLIISIGAGWYLVRD